MLARSRDPVSQCLSDAEKETLKRVRQVLKANNVLLVPTSPAHASSAAPVPRSEDTVPATPRARPHVDTPIPERGVSLAWLTNLATSLQQAGVPDDVTTLSLVNKLLLPLCKSRVLNPLLTEAVEGKAGIPHRRSSEDNGSSCNPLSLHRPVCSTVRQSGLDQSCSVKQRELGSYCTTRQRDLPQSQSVVQRELGSYCTTRQRDLPQSQSVVQRVIGNSGTIKQRALTQGGTIKHRETDEDMDEEDTEPDMHCRIGSNLKPLLNRYVTKVQALWELLPASHCGKADYYVVHAWQAGFQGFVKELSNRFNPPAEVGQPPPPAVDTSMIFFWLDFAVVPHSDVLGQTLDIDVIREAIMKPKSVLVVLDPQLLVLERTWTLMEMFTSIYHNPGKMELMFPSELDLDLAWQMHSKLVGLDIAHTETSRPEDKLCIIREIKNHVGIKRVSQILQENLMRIARATLRWGSLSQMAVYLALLLKEHEFAVLACVLSSIPQLATDDKALAEIREIFGIYDTDGSGELDIDEFIQVLDAAGFKESEARKIFDQVNADQGDGVGFGEFETWWVDSQKQNFLHSRKSQKELTFDELCTLMAELVKLLDRKGLQHYSGFFTEWLEKLQSGSVISTKQKLALPPTKGDLVEVADQLSWKMHASDYKGIATALFSFLQNNGDCLDINLADIPRDMTSEVDILKTILRLLDLLLGLLRWYPGKAHHAEHFFVMSERLESKVKALDNTQPGFADPAARHKGRKKLGPKMANSNGMYGVISNMVHLKYGQDRAMNTDLITEAGTALSRWMASNRECVNGRKGGGGLSSLTQDYLGTSTASGRGRLPPVSSPCSSPKSIGHAEDLSPSGSKVKLPSISH